ncbi:alpha/beta hydrolase [Roseibium sp. RKSG952]|uniref:alpha/beta hydrolase n=1 Tax=Roseibium sp. RKSG952 TaxID=2529384 RepID=UPI0012BC1469|nr:alpha/beta hydrolase [Roseibium sp. RKSG952]MTH96087.1 alpha/beta hydrolase [Roseibium sp. RKSG952]
MKFAGFLLSSALLATSAVAQPILEEKTQAFVDIVSEATPLYTLSHDGARKVLATVQQERIATAATMAEDTVFPVGPTGEVRIRIIRPEGADGKLPVIMYFHGGGWVMGDRNTHDNLIRELSAQTGAAVVFVEYDNAPEVKYPDNNEQAYAATEYVAKNADALGVDASRIAVAGDSAGGNMAAAVTLMAKERQGPELIHQVLFYPVTDDISDNSSYTAFGEGPFLTEKAMDYFLEANYPADRRDEVLAFPLRASVDQLKGLPDATVIVAENDLLRDEGEAYARKLTQAGVTVTATRYNGTIHDFVMLNALADTPAARAAISQAASELKKAFAS